MRAKERHFKAISEQTLDKSQTVSSSFFLELVIIDIRCGDFIQLLDVFVCQFAVPFETFLRMPFHVVGSRCNICDHFSRIRELISSSCGNP